VDSRNRPVSHKPESQPAHAVPPIRFDSSGRVTGNTVSTGMDCGSRCPDYIICANFRGFRQSCRMSIVQRNLGEYRDNGAEMPTNTSMVQPRRSILPFPTQPARLSAIGMKSADRRTSSAPHAPIGIATAVFLAHSSLCGVASAKPFEEYIKPMPTVAPLSSASWGTAALPRDLSNGIESAMGAGVHPQWYYWDGQIIRAKDGKYHMFMSTFDANSNFGTAWQGSDAYHAISQTNVLGPYLRQDYVYSTGGSTPHKGHNVSAVELPDGTYAVIVGEIVPFQIFKSSSLDGPWTGCSPQSDIGASNVSMFPRHDGKYQIVERNGRIAIADTLCGHYVKQTPTCAYTQNPTDAQGNPVVGSIYAKRTSIPGVSNPSYLWQEDPHIWRSGGTYHVVYSGSGDRVGWHVYSSDGLSWKDNGYAWSPRDYQKIFCYEGTTTCNAWYKMERPGVVLQDGHPTHMTWAVSDVDKDNQVTPGTNHGTKVVVIPFDGVAFDNDFGTGASGGAGTGGATSTGGVSAAAGTKATGGSSTTGGTKATAGTTSVVTAGGTSSNGGSQAVGGLSAMGGSQATGGLASNGGSKAAGGTTSASNVGGGSTRVTATGGAVTTGGVSNTPTGGVTAVSTANGGSSSPSSGTGTGGQTGGALGVGGVQTSGGLIGSTATGTSTIPPTGTGDASNTGGCGCRVAGGDSHSKSLAILGVLGLLSLRPRRRRIVR
jgi:MYXO-CTERM domain-containing protein